MPQQTTRTALKPQPFLCYNVQFIKTRFGALEFQPAKNNKQHQLLPSTSNTSNTHPTHTIQHTHLNSGSLSLLCPSPYSPLVFFFFVGVVLTLFPFLKKLRAMTVQETRTESPKSDETPSKKRPMASKKPSSPSSSQGALPHTPSHPLQSFRLALFLSRTLQNGSDLSPAGTSFLSFPPPLFF